MEHLGASYLDDHHWVFVTQRRHEGRSAILQHQDLLNDEVNYMRLIHAEMNSDFPSICMQGDHLVYSSKKGTWLYALPKVADRQEGPEGIIDLLPTWPKPNDRRRQTRAGMFSPPLLCVQPPSEESLSTIHFTTWTGQLANTVRAVLSGSDVGFSMDMGQLVQLPSPCPDLSHFVTSVHQGTHSTMGIVAFDQAHNLPQRYGMYRVSFISETFKSAGLMRLDRYVPVSLMQLRMNIDPSWCPSGWKMISVFFDEESARCIVQLEDKYLARRIKVLSLVN